MEETARTVANELNEIWGHLPDAQREDQIDAHMESDGFTQEEIDCQLERLGILTLYYTLEACPPSL